MWEALSLVCLSRTTPRCTVTGILLIIQQITSNNHSLSRHFLYVPLRSLWLPPLCKYETRLEFIWNPLEHVRRVENF
jgi:hypothetical protein